MSAHDRTLEPAAKRRLAPLLVAAAIAMSAGAISVSVALEQSTVTQGLTACVNWCIRQNPHAPNNVEKCQRQCQAYWYCNGRDAAKWTSHCRESRAYPGVLRMTTAPNPPQPPAAPKTATRKTP